MFQRVLNVNEQKKTLKFGANNKKKLEILR